MHPWWCDLGVTPESCLPPPRWARWAQQLRWQPGLALGCGAHPLPPCPPAPAAPESGPDPSSAILGQHGQLSHVGPVSRFTGRTRALRVYTHFSRNPHNRPEGNGASSPFKHQKAEPLLAKPSAKALGESLDKDLDFTCIHSTNVCWALALGWPYKQHKTSPPAGDLWAHPVPTPWEDEELLGPTGLIASRADSRGRGLLETTPPWGAEAPGIRLFSHPRWRGPGTSQLSTAPAFLPPSPPPRCPTSAPPPPRPRILQAPETPPLLPQSRHPAAGPAAPGASAFIWMPPGMGNSLAGMGARPLSLLFGTSS